MPSPSAENSLKEGRLTGLFYFLWLDNNNCKIYDVSKITAQDPDAGYKPDSELWGKVGDYHFWGEPFYGYYSQGDEWVVRKHMKLITEAGIDFLFFDTTNALIYEDKAKLVMKVLQEYYEDGFAIPKVMFYTNTASGETVQKIYDAIYKPEFCKDTWFCLNGKPVIIAVESECSEETKAFFNIKMSQWPNEPDKLGGWPWMDFAKPQRVFADLQGNPEVINVSVAQHPQLRFGDSVLYGETENCGRAFSKGRNDPAPNAYIKGANFEEQFERALETDPPIVLITGWNEWIAGRWQGIESRPIMFVDCANYEYSRDIEMMRDGYFDNFYMQLASYVRKYRGVSGCHTKDVGEVQEYYNFSDGDMPRDAMGQIDRYTNYTQRNAILKMQVSHTAEDLIIKLIAKTTINIPDTNSEDTGSFMNVYVSKGTAPGFDYVINAKPDFDKGLASVMRINRKGAEVSEERHCDDLNSTEIIGAASMEIYDNEITYKIPRKLLDICDSNQFELWLKAADSNKKYLRVDQFYEDGDVMPIGRLAYVYRGK
jgi:hypothetical protein